MFQIVKKIFHEKATGRCSYFVEARWQGGKFNCFIDDQEEFAAIGETVPVKDMGTVEIVKKPAENKR